MTQDKLDRINFLAKKSREQGLTETEKAEQQVLRDEYRASFIGNLKSQLDNTVIVRPDGSKEKVQPKGEK